MAGVKVEFSFLVAPEGSGTQFSVVGDFEGALIKGALGKAVEKDFGKQLDKTRRTTRRPGRGLRRGGVHHDVSRCSRPSTTPRWTSGVTMSRSR